MTRFYVAGLLGAVMVGLSIGLVAGIAHGLGLIGSCSSTGYIKGRPVPDCSASDVVKIVGIFPAVGLGLLGLVVSGRRAPRHKRTGTFGVAAWSFGYLIVGTSLIASAFNPATKAGGIDRWGWAIPGFIFIPLGLGGLLFMAFRKRKSALAQRLLATGVHTTARITAVRDTGVTINNNPRIALELEAETAQGPLKLEKTVTVSRLAIPREGDHVQIWYDRDDPQTFALGLPSTAQRAVTAGVAQALHALGSRPAVPPHVAEQAAAAAQGTPAAPTDLTATLERLASLHADGVLTDQEFETAKTRALARA